MKSNILTSCIQPDWAMAEVTPGARVAVQTRGGRRARSWWRLQTRRRKRSSRRGAEGSGGRRSPWETEAHGAPNGEGRSTQVAGRRKGGSTRGCQTVGTEAHAGTEQKRWVPNKFMAWLQRQDVACYGRAHRIYTWPVRAPRSHVDTHATVAQG